MSLPCSNATLMKSSLDRLLVLFDALLMIDPIDVDSYNQKVKITTLRHRLMPSYMSFNLILDQGTLRISDYVSIHEETDDTSFITCYFVYETLEIFQLLQYMGQLVSRVHLVARNMTNWNKTDLFVNFYDVLIDYAPMSLTSRAILVLGKVSVSSNVVTGAVMQGYKVSIGDLELFLTHARTEYDETNVVVLGNELFFVIRRKSEKKHALQFGNLDGKYPSLLTFFETLDSCNW
ncbi:hypothetical protein PsorP6_005194 [Peronosclerospora sorghi]|uniref:Uncharacterized protein n=1 Tax=Peronosclerospora sorghi TaxID=230839 RepID=A0ACC0W5I6_9STRA|nr:hypothetical protein PsorP6_005194 [Peronosclerospora sorghi]